MATDYRERDPLLRLLPPDVPDGFVALPPAEQTLRGRYWLMMFGAGYEVDHAWWFVLQEDPEWTAIMKEQLGRVDEADIPLMVQGRLTYERGKGVVPEGTVQ